MNKDEYIVDNRTKIGLSGCHIFPVYCMYRKIPYKNCLGIRKYFWKEVSHVIAERVTEEIKGHQKLEIPYSIKSILIDVLQKKANQNYIKRRLAKKELNYLNHNIL